MNVDKKLRGKVIRVRPSLNFPILTSHKLLLNQKEKRTRDFFDFVSIKLTEN